MVEIRCPLRVVALDSCERICSRFSARMRRLVRSILLLRCTGVEREGSFKPMPKARGKVTGSAKPSHGREWNGKQGRKAFIVASHHDQRTYIHVVLRPHLSRTHVGSQATAVRLASDMDRASLFVA